ncbi:hypothetical protein ACFXP3_27185 [Streptomyces sp. NPDC059096]|uniref:hypothetical protein n=1 Tax=Streptomyces sp. NPDC059096 TaxID=3346727 RepID=UPI00369ACB76
MSDDMEDVVGVLTEQIERRFATSMDKLTAAVAKAPNANRDATGVVQWHGLLVASQAALQQAEDDLLAALETRTGELADDPTLALAHRVNTAVTVRDGRAMVLRWLLGPDAQGDRAAERRARFSGAQRGPAVSTTMPARSAMRPAPQRGARR